MPSKAEVFFANLAVWEELREWKQGRNTMELHRSDLRDAKYSRYAPIIQNDVSAEQRQLEVDTNRLTISDIKADTGLLRRQLSEWKAGVRTYARSRSRSPRRDEIKADSTSARRAEALGFVAAHTVIRSEAETRMKAMIDERDATIAKQAKLIADLEAGDELIGPVMKSNSTYRLDDEEYWKRRLEKPDMNYSVRQFINEVRQKSYIVWDMLH
jgi:predicted ATPase